MKDLRIKAMTSKTGKPVPNQTIVSFTLEDGTKVEQFRSYDTVIVERVWAWEGVKTYVSNTFYDFSVTTSRYRREYLNGEGIADTRKKILSGEYIAVDSERGDTELRPV